MRNYLMLVISDFSEFVLPREIQKKKKKTKRVLDTSIVSYEIRVISLRAKNISLGNERNKRFIYI